MLSVGMGFIGCATSTPPDNGTSGNSLKGACGSPIANRPEKVEAEIADEIPNQLKDQLGKSFKIKAVYKNGYLVLYVEGEIYGVDGLKDFADKVNDFSGDGCVKKIIFLPEGSIESGQYLSEPGFEWTACPHPTQPCSNGVCACERHLTSGNANSNFSNLSKPGNSSNGGPTYSP